MDDVVVWINLIIYDLDVEGLKCLYYVGMSNYDVGCMCGEFVKEVIFDGGEVMIFVGCFE